MDKCQKLDSLFDAFIKTGSKTELINIKNKILSLTEEHIEIDRTVLTVMLQGYSYDLDIFIENKSAENKYFTFEKEITTLKTSLKQQFYCR